MKGIGKKISHKLSFFKDNKDNLVVLIAITILNSIALLMFYFRIDLWKNLIYISAVIVYVILLNNELIYLTKIYKMDLEDLDWGKRNSVGVMKVKAARMRGIGTSSSWDSVIKKIEIDGQNMIERRTIQYNRDYIRSIFIPISRLLKK